MPEPDDGPRPDEGTEGMFAKLNRMTSALDRLQTDADDRIARLERKQRAQARQLDRWGEEFAELMDELVRRLTATGEHLLRLDTALSETADRHPESQPALDALRADVRTESHRLSAHADLMKRMAYRVYGLAPPGARRQTTPLIPYDRALRRRLNNLLMLTLGVGGLLQFTGLLPIAHLAADIAQHVGPALCAFAAGVGVAHDTLRRRIRTTPTRQ